MKGMVKTQVQDIASKYLGPQTAMEFLARADLPEILPATAETILGVLQASIANHDTNAVLIDKIMEASGVADWQAERIARTETAHAENAARLERFRVEGDEYVEFVAGESERTCEECAQYHGKIFKLGTEPELPIHPNCRCTYIAAYPDWQASLGAQNEA